jgi:hypothetical protein
MARTAGAGVGGRRGVGLKKKKPPEAASPRGAKDFNYFSEAIWPLPMFAFASFSRRAQDADVAEGHTLSLD